MPFEESAFRLSLTAIEWILGNYLLCDPQRPLAPFYISRWPNYRAWSRRHVRHVLLHVRATDGHHGLH